MSKSILILLTLILSLPAYSQFAGCKCNEIFDQDVKTQFISYNREISKKFFYEYFNSSESERRSMKKNRRDEFGASTVVEAIPSSFTGSSSGNSSSSLLHSISLQALKQNYVSDEQINMIFTTFVPSLAFSSYNLCLEKCSEYVINKAGVSVIAIEDNEEMVILKLEFKSIPASGYVTISDSKYIGGEALRNSSGQVSFYEGRIIKDGQILYEHIKRMPQKDLNVTLTFLESNVGSGQTTFKSKSKEKTISATPVGSIIASIVPYENFMKINDLPSSGDLSQVIWVPCDGRDVSSSLYAKGGLDFTKVPDLRGLFLRSVNDYGVLNAGTIIDNNLNPENTAAGKTQNDAFKAHSHGIPKNDKTGRKGCKSALSGCGEGAIHGEVGITGDNETRPKNMTVYYYIKIN